jgi:nucleoside-triphosphatase THEP1
MKNVFLGYRLFLFFMVVYVFQIGSLAVHAATFTEVTAPEVKHMVDNEKVVIVNNLSPLEFDLQHITGSINIPINTLTTTKLLPENKEIPLVFYCMNEK